MRIEEMLAELAPVIGREKANRLWLLYGLEDDWQKKNEIEGMIRTLTAKHLDHYFSDEKILLQPPEGSDVSGFHLGTSYYGDEPRGEFFISEAMLNEHLFAGGATGAGKTNLGLLLVKQMLHKSMPFTLLSWKREYRGALLTGWTGADNLKFFTVGRNVVPFSFNPFEPPPGTTRDVWAERIVDVLSHAYFLGHGVKYLLHQTLNELERPCTESLLARLKAVKAIGRRRQWLDSAVRAVGDLCLGPAGKAFLPNGTTDLQSLLQNQTILELDALGEDAKTFFAEAMLAWIHQYRLQGGGGGKLKHVNVLEEAHRLILKRGNAESETVMDMVFREIRELGEAIVFFDQNLSTISKTALGNAGTTLLFRQKHGDDLRAGTDLVLLDWQKKDWLGRLPTGWAIAKTPEEGPFLLKVPLAEIPKRIFSDQELQKRFSSYSASDSIVSSSRPADQDISPIPTAEKEDGGTEEMLDESEIRFMTDVMNHSGGVVERYRRLGLSRRKGNAVKDKLVQKEMIEESVVPVGRGAVKFLVITLRGKKAMEPSGIQISGVNLSSKLGGAVHRFWIDRIAEELAEAGYHVEREFRLSNGGCVDIVAQKDGKRFAFEVETGKSDISNNLEKTSDSPFDKIVIIPTSELGKKKLLDLIASTGKTA